MNGRSIQRIDGASALPASLRGGAVAIGNFDGVHRGHLAVLTRALEEARSRGIPALVLTFEPHPRTIFRPDQPLFVLTPAPVRAKLLEAVGFDAVVEQPFDRAFSAHSASRFVEETLVAHLGIAHAVTGFDFHFGKDRQGGPAFLMAAGREQGFGVTLVDAFRDEGAEIISSSRIRGLLTAGEVAEAAGLLGYRFTVEAEIIHGQQLGRTIGIPTANMALPDSTTLKHGIYAVRLRRADGSLHDGVASFGRRPTVTDNGAPLLETYIFDLDADLYGEVCAVSFFAFLRNEEKFDSLEALQAQINRDIDEARAVLADPRPLSELDLRVAF